MSARTCRLTCGFTASTSSIGTGLIGSLDGHVVLRHEVCSANSCQAGREVADRRRVGPRPERVEHAQLERAEDAFERIAGERLEHDGNGRGPGDCPDPAPD